MNNYVGIDLGTTNSAVCSYNGVSTRIWKSPEQNDVTPSAIYIDQRGNKYVGRRAYDAASLYPDNAAVLFKRFMGTKTPVRFSAPDITMTPEECSAEVLRTLFGYLPEELRHDPNLGVVITVPAAFNQMQKNATMNAAELAGFNQFALMQEPVAAVMNIMNVSDVDGIFIVYDLGGGTQDVAVAESLGGEINLLSHGGIAMCGGRDFDRLIVDNVVKPWLHEKFNLPQDLSISPKFKSLLRLAAWATERAKIELSAREEVLISVNEMDARIRDESDTEIYIDIPFNRNMLDHLIEERIDDSIQAVKETLAKGGLSPHDVNRIVFIGGPTSYKPLRDKVSFELGISSSTEVNPITAVAEGAAIFAESIDWKSAHRKRKSNRESYNLSGPLDLNFKYEARTPDKKAKIIVETNNEIPPGTEFQIDSLDTGTTSGRVALENGAKIEVDLPKREENCFKVFVFDVNGDLLLHGEDKIIITRTAATIGAIPASHSIGIEVVPKRGGISEIDWLVRAGDSLPKKGQKIYKAGETLKSGSLRSLNFKVREGESDYPPDNRFVGHLKITGSDFDEGVIPSGADLHCEYEMLDSGSIVFKISVPSIGAIFQSNRNFYSHQEGQMDFDKEAKLVKEKGERTSQKLKEYEKVADNRDDSLFTQAWTKLLPSSKLNQDESDVERVQEAMEGVQSARNILVEIRKSNLEKIRQSELDDISSMFDSHCRKFARPSELNSFDNLFRTAQRSINDNEFENHKSELKGRIFEILWRQDWVVVEKFKYFASSQHHFLDVIQSKDLISKGWSALNNDDIDELRRIVIALHQILIDDDEDMNDPINILRG